MWPVLMSWMPVRRWTSVELSLIGWRPIRAPAAAAPSSTRPWGPGSRLFGEASGRGAASAGGKVAVIRVSRDDRRRPITPEGEKGADDHRKADAERHGDQDAIE